MINRNKNLIVKLLMFLVLIFILYFTYEQIFNKSNEEYNQYQTRMQKIIDQHLSNVERNSLNQITLEETLELVRKGISFDNIMITTLIDTYFNRAGESFPTQYEVVTKIKGNIILEVQEPSTFWHDLQTGELTILSHHTYSVTTGYSFESIAINQNIYNTLKDKSWDFEFLGTEIYNDTELIVVQLFHESDTVWLTDVGEIPGGIVTMLELFWIDSNTGKVFKNISSMVTIDSLLIDVITFEIKKDILNDHDVRRPDLTDYEKIGAGW